MKPKHHAVHLCELPGDANGPAQTIAADQQSLHGPTCKVTEGKDVEMAQDALPCYHRAVYSIFLQKEKLLYLFLLKMKLNRMLIIMFLFKVRTS